MTAKQIPLSFPVRESYSRDNFMPCDGNRDALAWIDRWPDWPSPALVIYGPKGCGKTHLLSLWAEKANKDDLAIDDAQTIFGNIDNEEHLFHAYNLAKENGTTILLTMEHPVAQQSILLPDLASRLRAAPQIEVTEPDDLALQAVFMKLMHDRQIKITPDVIGYVIPRIERSYNAVIDLVSRLDNASLSEKRAVTIPLVKTILNEPSLL